MMKSLTELFGVRQGCCKTQSEKLLKKKKKKEGCEPRQGSFPLPTH